MTMGQDVEFAKLISNLYSEVFQRRRSGDNTILKKSAHAVEDLEIVEDIHSNLNASLTFQWGPGGVTPSVLSTVGTKLAGQWGEAVWS